MKKKKLLKSASLVALSAVMMCGAATAFAGCGGNDANTIVVSMFCSEVDSAMNRTNCENWAKEYTQKLRESGEFTEDREVKINFSYQPNTDTYFTGLANLVASNSQPDVFYVSPKYVKTWSNANKILDLAPSLAADAENVTGEKGIWEDSLAFYGYSKDEKYTSGDRIEFKDGKFVTVADGVEVGIYGLPKDYSNFGLGFNEVFFTPEVREALTSTKTTDRKGVHGAEYNSAKLTYNGESNVVTVDGEDAPLVNIGVPTYYKPYNFYIFASYDDAVAGGDPMANAVERFTGGDGYCVTIPGWPGDTFEDAKKDKATKNNPWANVDTTIPEDYVDENATYDTTQGFITYTYAEYSALTWAITYYVNTYDWQGNGTGGAKTATSVKNVYGNDQYDGVLYLLPWLAGNDAQYLDEKSTTAINGSDPTSIGTDTYTTQHRKLNGEYEDVQIQYGVNSQKFIDTVGAFHAYGSDWNGSSNNAGDTTKKKQSGWDLFVAGNCVFYGVGTWNAGDLNATDRNVLRYRLMPGPVSEDFALYSNIKTADYEMKEYGNSSKSSFTGDEIKANQLLRQDQWGARMDSVGYGVSALVADQGWKKDAAIDLVKYLTITPETQVSLTYSGAQLPNFKYQCQDYYNKTGDFEKMVTPEDEEFDDTYQIAKDMYAASQKSETRSMTVEQWLQANHPDIVSGGKYYTLYKDTLLSTFANLNHAMRTLFLVAYTKADRDLSLRMQYGLNATRDSAMYTFNDAWIKVLDPRGSGAVMAYDAQTPRPNMGNILDSLLYAKDAKDASKMPSAGQSYGTPAWWCLHSANEVQRQLELAIQKENNLLG